MEEFEWDTGNSEKNWIKHQVSSKECEEVFFNKPVVIFKDILHSQTEDRYVVLGITNKRRLLYVVFTMHNEKNRIISARDQTKKEKELYYYESKTKFS